jgi:hypothetical protein
MTILTQEYKYKVLDRLLKAKESFESACSKSGLNIGQAIKYLKFKYPYPLSS